MGGGRGGLPNTKRGSGQSTSGPIYEKWGGGGGAIRFRSITKSGVGGGNSLQVHYEKWGGGGGGGNSLQVHYEKWGGGSDVSSPIGVWGKAPEASQAGTRTT